VNLNVLAVPEQVMSTLDQAEVKKRWAARGFSCELWIDALGRVWKDFVHDTDELVMLVEGEERLGCHGRRYDRR
jgi:hypothetical protein